MIKKFLAVLLLFFSIGHCKIRINWQTNCPDIYTKIKTQSYSDYIKEQSRNFINKKSINLPLDPLTTIDKETFEKIKTINPVIECAYISLPIDWTQPNNGRNTTYYVHRVKASKGRRVGQFWFNQGGPGGSGRAIRVLLSFALWQSLEGTYDIIVPDHRGTGWSNGLNCPEQERNPIFPFDAKLLNDCLEYSRRRWGADYQQSITPTSAAKDAHHVLLSIKEDEGGKAIMGGVSYGAFLMNRYMQVYPNDGIDAFVVDSIAPPQLTEFLKYDRLASVETQHLLENCAEDDFCKTKLSNPVALLRRLFNLIENGKHCSDIVEYLTPVLFRRLMFAFTASRDFSEFIAPVIYRLVRCHPTFDIPVLKNFLKFYGVIPSKGFKSTIENEFVDSSIITYYTIGATELLYNGTNLPSLEEIIRIDNTLLSSIFLSPTMRFVSDHWRRYRTDEFFNGFSQTRTPFILLQGGLDPQTPWFYAPWWFDRVKKTENQYMVKFPIYPHGPIISPCGRKITSEFIKNPLVQPNIECVEREVSKLDWRGRSDKKRYFSELVFGIADMWENS